MKTKATFFLLLALMLLICACAGDANPTSGTTMLAGTTGTSATTTAPTTASTATVTASTPTTAPTTASTTATTTASTSASGTSATTTKPTTKSTKITTTIIKPPLTDIIAPTGPAFVYDDARAQMMDSMIFRALKYLGYDRAGELQHYGLLYEPAYCGIELQDLYEAGGLQNYPLTPIEYANGIYGTVTRSARPGEQTATGLVPDIDQFVKKGIVCTSFVDYYYINYLRNIEGVNVSHIISAYNKTGDGKVVIRDGWIVDHWTKTAELLVERGYATVYLFDLEDSQAPASGPVTEGQVRYEEALKTMPIGTLVRFGRENNGNVHFGVYAGYYNGQAYLIHMSSNRGPEIVTFDHFNRVDLFPRSYPLAFYVIDGACET